MSFDTLPCPRCGMFNTIPCGSMPLDMLDDEFADYHCLNPDCWFAWNLKDYTMEDYDIAVDKACIRRHTNV